MVSAVLRQAAFAIPPFSEHKKSVHQNITYSKSELEVKIKELLNS